MRPVGVSIPLPPHGQCGALPIELTGHLILRTYRFFIAPSKINALLLIVPNNAARFLVTIATIGDNIIVAYHLAIVTSERVSKYVANPISNQHIGSYSGIKQI